MCRRLSSNSSSRFAATRVADPALAGGTTTSCCPASAQTRTANIKNAMRQPEVGQQRDQQHEREEDGVAIVCVSEYSERLVHVPRPGA